MTKTTKAPKPEDIIQEQIATIDEQLGKIEKRMAKFNELNETKQKLLSARRALMGGNRTTGAGGSRLTMEDIIDYLDKNPGATSSAIAEKFGVALTTVSSHIYRNKDRFIKKGHGYYKRDPEAGINGPEDIEEDE